MQPLNKQTIRNQFAKRLRELRVPRGFASARSLARALEIDENRYTRYERAEVEPDLFMIRKICQILDVTPCDLLGAAEKNRKMSGGRRVMRASGDQSGNDDHAGNSHHPGGSGLDVTTAAWSLAQVIVNVRQTGRHADGDVTMPASPLADIGEAGALYQTLMRAPFETISALSQEPALHHARQPQAQELREAINGFVDVLKAKRGL